MCVSSALVLLEEKADATEISTALKELAGVFV